MRTTSPRREYEISLFNSPASSVGVYLLSTRAGALGITLTGADTVIMYDTDWNPTWDKQVNLVCRVLEF
jgi:SNF2 family DNA or RNA helicase